MARNTDETSVTIQPLEERMWASPEHEDVVADRSRNWVTSLQDNGFLSSPNQMRLMEIASESALASIELMHDCVTVDAEIRGGRPVLIGTGFTVAQALAELASSSGVTEVAEDFSLKSDSIRKLLHWLSLRFEQSWTKRV